MDIKLKGVKNIRDFSEYGHPGYIRSALLMNATDEDVDILYNKYGLRTVIDLRTPREASEKPDRVIPGVNYIHMPIFEDAWFGISHDSESDRSLDYKKLPDMSKLYADLATDERCVKRIKQVMDIINDPEREGAVLWHCSEGKDRCGMISAKFLISKGFDYDTVLKDYLRTNRTNFSKAYKYCLGVLLKTRDLKFAKKIRDIFLAKKRYFDAAYERLREI